MLLLLFSLLFSAVVAGISTTVLFETSHQRNVSVVAIYAGRSYHDEITASMSCLFHTMGYKVIVYADSNVRLFGVRFPFTNSRILDSDSYYGRCVHEWIPTSSRGTLEENTDVLVMISYPMKTARRTSDEVAYQMIRQIYDKKLPTKLLLVTHKAQDQFWKYLPRIEPYVPLSRVSFVFLAEHVYHSGLRVIGNHSAVQLAYIHPTVPLRMLFDKDRSIGLEMGPGNAVITFAIQGHFGGQHSKRRRVAPAVECLRDLAVANGTLSALALIGRGAAAADIGRKQPHRSVQVRRYKDLKPRAFHAAVANAQYLLTAAGNDAYSSTQATSTVPLALTLQRPLVTTRAFLDLYPCLRDSAVLQGLTGDTDCEGIHQAVRQWAHRGPSYAAARREMRRCGEELWQQSLHTLQTLLGSMGTCTVQPE